MPPFNGPFYPVSKTRIADITDGTSNTAAFAEMGKGDMSNAIATEKTDSFWTQTWPSTPEQAISDCQSFAVTNLAFQGLSTAGVPWITGSTSAMYNHVNVPNKRTCIFPPGRIMNTANSYHPGGVNVTLCDGSVRFVKDSISLAIWRLWGPEMAARSSAPIPTEQGIKGDSLMNHSSIRATLGCLAASLAMAIPAGCGGLKPTDPDQARETLSLALNAWRDGRSMDDVTTGSPPITVADPSWKAGYKLTGYQVSEATKTVGFDLNIPVELDSPGSPGQGRAGEGQVHRERPAGANGDPIAVLNPERRPPRAAARLFSIRRNGPITTR